MRFGESKCKLPQNVDGVSGETNVVNLWKQNRSDILNIIKDSRDKRALTSLLDQLAKGEINFITAA